VCGNEGRKGLRRDLKKDRIMQKNPMPLREREKKEEEKERGKS
jgi:hypothetical protein